MKKNVCLIFAAMISTSLLAAEPLVPAAAPSTNAPVQPAPERKAPPKRAPVKKTPAPELRSEPLVPGPAVVNVRIGPVNVRGKAGIKGEVITRMTNGEPVTVIEEVHLPHSGADEPSAWAKIALPEKAHAWIHTSYLDRSNMTVKASELRLRGGPGENYSILGTLKRGDTVKEVQTKGDWMEIETTNPTFAFMAAQYLKQEPAVLATATEPPPATTTVAETATATAATTEGVTEMPAGTNELTAATTTEATPTTTTPTIEEPPLPRVVQREGFVRGTISIQAPTHFELISPDNRKTINYLYTTSPSLDLSRYKGLHIIVTGEEGLDERWKNTPVLTIQRIQVLE